MQHHPSPPCALANSVLVATVLGAAAIGCPIGPAAEPEPMGQLPTAVTTAVPNWMPFRILAGRSSEADPRERRLADLRQLTFDGSSAAAVWSRDGKHLLFESSRSGADCWQIYGLELETGKVERLTPTDGWARSAAYGPPEEDLLLFAYSPSTTGSPACTSLTARLRADRWALPSCDIYSAEPGSSEVSKLIASPGYDAELAATQDGTKLVFTSLRDGDPELYVANSDGSKLRRITQAPGYDGGAAFAPNAAQLVWQAQRPGKDALADYRERLARGELLLDALDIVVAGAGGQQPRVVVRNGRLNITPSFLPDSRRVIYASNENDDRPRGGDEFDLYAVDPDGPVTITGGPARERITYHPGFDGDPRVSPDGRYVAFTSSRYSATPGGTNVFVARWVEGFHGWADDAD